MYPSFTELEMDEVLTARITHGHNGFVKYINANQIQTVNHQNEDCFLCITVDRVIELVKDDNIIILNIGLHYYHSSMAKILKVLRQLTAELHLLSMDGAKIIFRMTLPQHFNSITQTGWYQDTTKEEKHKKDCSFINNPARHFIDNTVRKYTLKYGFQILDEFEIFSARSDLHQRVHGIKDCTHYCFTMETIMPQLALLIQLL